MTTVESKVVSLQKNDEEVFKIISSFKNFTPFVEAAKIEDWQAGDDWCRFTAEGLGKAGLRIIEKEEFKTIKITGDGGIPFDFNLWIQLKHLAAADTRMKITLKADLNMMMKMMIESKLQGGMDALADQIAKAFNS